MKYARSVAELMDSNSILLIGTDRIACHRKGKNKKKRKKSCERNIKIIVFFFFI